MLKLSAYSTKSENDSGRYYVFNSLWWKSLRSNEDYRPHKRNPGARLFASMFAAFIGFFALQGAAHASTWYVSKLSTGTVHDGRTWATAWTDFGGTTPQARIDWSLVQPGDTIYVDAGATRSTVTYTTPLVVQKSNLNIAIPVNDASHNKGQVVLDCASVTAIDLTKFNVENVTIQGSHWLSNTTIYMPATYFAPFGGYQSLQYAPNFRVSSNNTGTGIAVGPNAKNIVLRNLHVMGNFYGLYLTGGTTYSYYLMVNQNAFGVISFPAASAKNQYAYFYYSWFFNANPNAQVSNCFSYSNPASTFDLNFYYSIIGPGFGNAIYCQSAYDNINVTYTLFLNNKFDMRCLNPPRSVNLTYDILFKPSKDRNNLANYNVGMTTVPNNKVFGTIVHGGQVYVTGTTSLGMYNKQFNTTGNTLVLSPSQEDPLFASNVSAISSQATFNEYTALDLTPANGTPGTPYTIHSVNELYSKVPKGN